MSDKLPLLNAANNFSGVDEDANLNKKSILKNSPFHWRKYFSKNGDDNNYAILSDNGEHINSGQTVGLFRLFKFANRTDIILMIMAVLLIVVQTVCILFSVIFYGLLTGLFAEEALGNHCDIQNHTSTYAPDNNETYFNGLNDVSSSSHAVLLSTLPTSTILFRHKIMNIIHWGFVIGAIEFVSLWIGSYMWNLSIRRQIQRMTIALFQSIVQRKVSHMDTKSAAELNRKLFDNIEKIQHGIGFEFLILVTTLIGFIGYVIASFIVNWKLTLVMFFLLPVVIGTSYLFSKFVAKEAMHELTVYSQAGQIVEEVFSSIRTVLSLNGSKFEQKRYEKALKPTHRVNVRRGAVFGIFTGWLSLMSYLVYAVGFIFGSLLISRNSNGGVKIADVFVIIAIFAESFSFLSFIGPFFQSYAEAVGAAVPVFRLLDEGNDPNINEGDVWNKDEDTVQNVNGDIEFENVNFFYPSRKDAAVLRNLSLVAHAGKTTAIVGSSGCGKSTIMSLFLRYYEPSSGRIMFNGQPITDYTVKEFRNFIGVVSQEPILFATSIYENIRYGKVNATRDEIVQAAKEANAHDFIMRLPYKYETLVGERGVQLSGGEKQRIALARALVKQPTVLLLDEATSALDNVSENIVQSALNRACKGRTTLVIAHRLTTIQNADQIYVLDKGTVIEQGSHETLMAKVGGRYQSMVRAQQMQAMDDDDDTVNMQENRSYEEELKSLGRARGLSSSVATDMIEEDSKPLKQRSAFLRLLLMQRTEWAIVLFACTICVLNGVAEPVLAYFIARIIDAFKYCLKSQIRYHVLILSIGFILFGIFIMFLRFVQYTAFAISGSRLTHRIRLLAFGCLLRQEVAYFDRPENSSSAICTRLSSDAAAIQEMVGVRLGSICEVFALVVSGFVFGCLVSWQLSLIALVALFILSVTLAVELSVRMWLSTKTDPVIESASTLAGEVIYNMRTVKQLSMENEVLRLYTNHLKQLHLLSWKPEILFSMTFGILWILEIYTLAFMYWRALILFERHEITGHRIVMFLAFAIFSLQALKLIGMIAERIADSASAAEGFFELFDRVPLIDNDSTGGLILKDFRGKISFNNVKFIYPTRPSAVILKNLQLNIEPSQSIALVGTSGCGKSTIIQLLERFYDATAGRIYIDNIDIRQLNIRWLRSQIGLVSQEPILFDLTIAENIAYGLEDVAMNDIIKAAKVANAHEFIESLSEGYNTRVGMKGIFLSGGEKQRIAIARVLLRRPKILLLDEATSAMDADNERIIQEALEKAQIDDPSRTSLIIAHRLSTVRSCNSISVVERGRIIESGTHADLVQRRGPYYNMLSQNQLQ